ncbi:MAG: hypothetical protein GY862_34680, partial [Gammaproteobacteria bacterium]|nr:hypothetical protein [Gammaproteobacteria bacterium]
LIIATVLCASGLGDLGDISTDTDKRWMKQLLVAIAIMILIFSSVCFALVSVSYVTEALTVKKNLIVSYSLTFFIASFITGGSCVVFSVYGNSDGTDQ